MIPGIGMRRSKQIVTLCSMLCILGIMRLSLLIDVASNTNVNTASNINVNTASNTNVITASNTNVDTAINKTVNTAGNTTEMKYILYWNEAYGSKEYGFCCGRGWYPSYSSEILLTLSYRALPICWV